MQKGFLLKIIILAVALAVVAAVVFPIGRAGSDKASSQTTGTTTFFRQFVAAGGPIVWFVLLPMSIAMVSLSIEHCFTLRRKNLLPAGAGKDIINIIQQFGYKRLAVRLAGRRDFVSTAVCRAMGQNGPRSRATRNLLAESLQEQALRLLRKIEWINIIGNVAPMVGLFGTVYGMIKAFNGIVIAGGQPQPAQLAEGISIALVTTFWGLLIAIPALGIHGIFRNRIETLASEAAMQAESVLAEMTRSIETSDKQQRAKQRQQINSQQRQPIKTLQPSQNITQPVQKI